MPKVLARGIAASFVAAALAAAGPALGGDPEPVPYAAEFKWGGKITFGLLEKKRKVRDISIRRIRANCEGQNARLSFVIFGKAEVLSDRSFFVRSRDPEGRGKAIVKGTFSEDFETVQGKARLYGSYRLAGASGWTKCETGKQPFLATIAR